MTTEIDLIPSDDDTPEPRYPIKCRKMSLKPEAAILKNEYVGDHEGRDGRIRSKNIVEWAVVQDGNLLYSAQTRREAREYLARHGLIEIK